MTASDPAPCRLCGAEVLPHVRQRLLGKHDVQFQRCPRCDLIQSEPPYWLDEAYSHAISALDTGAIQRNQICGRLTITVARVLGIDARARCLDYGGGHGVFARMMRDLGFDFRCWDAHAENLFARGFEGDIRAPHQLVTAFEVLEHLGDVAGQLHQLFSVGHDHIFIGTVLHDGAPDGWHYYVPEAGQHIAFYSPRTLRVIAERFGYDATIGPAYSVFSRQTLGPVRRALLGRLMRQPVLGWAVGALTPTLVLQKLGLARGYTQSDFEALRVRGGESRPPRG